MNNPCRGCAAIDGIGSCDSFNENGECPCTECIVKTMCLETCEKLRDWTKTLQLHGGVS